VLTLERTAAVASRAAREKVAFGELRSPDDAIAALDAVTEDDVREVAARLEGDPVVACVGPHTEAEFE
jgi:predicted Zn-dependent peptidase